MIGPGLPRAGADQRDVHYTPGVGARGAFRVPRQPVDLRGPAPQRLSDPGEPASGARPARRCYPQIELSPSTNRPIPSVTVSLSNAPNATRR